jgi:hypothetical protein
MDNTGIEEILDPPALIELPRFPRFPRFPLSRLPLPRLPLPCLLLLSLLEAHISLGDVVGTISGCSMMKN